MNRISNARRIAQASWVVLGKDRELVVIPLIAGPLAIVAFAAVAAPGYFLLGGWDAQGPSQYALYLVWAAALVAAGWMLAIGQAAVISGAGRRMDGGDPTLTTSFAAARTRTGRLLGWALLDTVVALVLDQIAQRLGIIGRIVAWIGDAAFTALSFLALPIIVFEDVGAIEALKRSSRLLKETWGEQATFRVGLGLLGFLVTLPVMFLGIGLALSSSAVLAVLGVIIAIVWVVLVTAVISALSAIYKTTLYRWAKGLSVDPAFNPAELTGAFAHH